MTNQRSFHFRTPAAGALKSLPHIFCLLLAGYALLSGADARAGSPGKIQFAYVPTGYTPINGFVNFKVSRVEGSDGAVSAVCFTMDGTGKAGVDYTALTQTLSWADGDAADKIFPVPFINRNLNDGTEVAFTANLKNPTGGAVIGSLPVATEMIRYPGQSTQPTVEISSPPADVSVVTGTRLNVAAAVDDPNGLLKSVQFFLDDQLIGLSGAAPFTLAITAPAPGSHMLKAVATDEQGRMSSSTSTFTVLADDPNDPVPEAALYTNVGGRNLAGGSSVVLSASATSLSPDGTPLARVDFYADNAIIASYDGRGSLLKGESGFERSDRRTADERLSAASTNAAGAAPVANGSVFTAAWSIPNLTKLVNLLIVATTQGGRSQVSAPITVQAVAITADSDKPPVAVVKNVFGGPRARTGVKITVPVQVSDPDASRGHLEDGERRTADFNSTPTGIISKMEFFLNQVKVGTATQPPYSFDFTPASPGSYAINAIATDKAGLAGVATPLVIKALSVSPTVTLDLGAANSARKTVAAGSTVPITVRRVGDDLSNALNVAYKIQGSAIPRVNYKRLRGTVTIPAGATSASIKLTTLANAATDGATTLQLKLLPSAAGIYKPAKSSQVKILIQDK